MSVSALSVVNEAALAVGDPAFTHIKQPEWLAILNISCRDVARKLRLVLHTATFDIVAGDSDYAAPDDCVQVKSLRWSSNPADPTSWAWLGEMFEDEHRQVTDRSTASGDPAKYLMRVDTFAIYPTPEVSVAGGGKIQYWGMPDEVTNISTQPIPIIDIMRDTLRERMCIYGFRRLEKWDAAEQREKEWQATLVVDRDRLEDRSADRRTRLRSHASTTWGQR